jgi:hypothetical protein
MMIGNHDDELRRGQLDMRNDETARRVQATEAYDAIPSLDNHGEMIRLILVEVSLLAEKYRSVRRHDIPHVRELSGLLDVLWQEIEMVASTPRGLLAPTDEAMPAKVVRQLEHQS